MVEHQAFEEGASASMSGRDWLMSAEKCAVRSKPTLIRGNLFMFQKCSHASLICGSFNHTTAAS